MDEIERKERKLENLTIDEQIDEKRSSIAVRKALEKDLKRKHGPNWKSILGLIGKIKPNREAIQELYSAGAELKDSNNPRRFRRL